MSDPDTPALRPDGTLKDASKIDWVHSPSSETRVLPPEPENTSLGDSMADDSDGNRSSQGVGLTPLKGFKGKQPAILVSGKHVAKPSNKVSALKEQQLSPRTKLFFSRFEGLSSINTIIYI